MSNTTIEIGDIAIAVGFYTKGDEKKKRYRRVGSLMMTTRDDGSEGLWIKFNADALAPSLYVMARCCMQAGDDQAVLSVFEKEEKKPSEQEEAERMGADL